MIAIIDYGLGNLASVSNAFTKLGIPTEISSDPLVLTKTKALIFPGVGAAGEGMKNLAKKGLTKVIQEEVKRGKPVLGICLGMQLLFDKSEEGNVNCLGLLKGQVKKFRKERKIPQIGWNQVTMKKLFFNIPDKSFFYFVNSYYCLPAEKSIIVGETDYGEKFASIIVQNNIIATQFHPEKSGKVGFQLLKNWRNYYVD
ncbi:imidazole glycerol phosphate synthase subunit HisH [Candidatus Microgenomates bacterium]|nr:imidazole glycerol phosphate synthase subunit HisH [Candidatus Microgenomates bacterium]